MIDANGGNGHRLEALESFEKMEEEGNNILPDSVTLLTVLSARSHSGMVEHGRECFDSMQKKYNLARGPVHGYLRRADQMEEVWCMFDKMVKDQTKPRAAVWAATLNACSKNMDIIAGELVTKNLLA